MIAPLGTRVNLRFTSARPAPRAVYITPSGRRNLITTVSKKRKAKSTPPPKPSLPDTSPHVAQRDKLDWPLTIRHRNDLTTKQQGYRDLILDKRASVIFISGPAGTSKTWLAIYSGLLLLQQGRMSHITFVRTVIESASKSLGALPGEADAKMSPYLTPLMDKLEELLPANEVRRMMAEERAVGIPVGYLRGASLNAQYVVVDEAQNYTLKELTTVLTRIGRYSKMVIIGDPDQSDLPNGSGRAFASLFDWFNQPSYQDKGIHCVSFTKADIVRSGVARDLVEALEQYREAHAAPKH